MLEPLGRSQVLSYLYRLSEKGFRFALFSLEHEQDISAANVSRLERELLQHGVEWRWDLYRHGGIGDVLENLWTAYKNVRDLCKSRGIGLIHARSFFPAVIARIINLFNGIPYLFDLRGCWAEERCAEGFWSTKDIGYKAAKLIERGLIRHAKAVVTLTELHANEITKLSRAPESITVIPTCADYDLFADSDMDCLPSEISTRLRDKLVLAMVGSINKSYCVQQSFELFQEVRKLRHDAHLLCLTRQTNRMHDLLRDYGVPESDYTVQSVPHEEMPSWMALIDWGLLLMNDGEAKRGSMPTKLGEYFAAGVRIAQYGCNVEVSDNVRASGCGIVLANLSPEELRRTAQYIASDKLAKKNRSAAPIATRGYFGIENGVKKYAEIYSNVSRKEVTG